MNMTTLNGARDRVDGSCIAAAGAGAKNVIANTITTIVMTAPAIIAHPGRQKKEIADPGIGNRQSAGWIAQSASLRFVHFSSAAPNVMHVI
jgi:hypothetical protein